LRELSLDWQGARIVINSSSLCYQNRPASKTASAPAGFDPSVAEVFRGQRSWVFAQLIEVIIQNLRIKIAGTNIRAGAPMAGWYVLNQRKRALDQLIIVVGEPQFIGCIHSNTNNVSTG